MLIFTFLLLLASCTAIGEKYPVPPAHDGFIPPILSFDELIDQSSVPGLPAPLSPPRSGANTPAPRAAAQPEIQQSSKQPIYGMDHLIPELNFGSVYEPQPGPSWQDPYQQPYQNQNPNSIYTPQTSQSQSSYGHLGQASSSGQLASGQLAFLGQASNSGQLASGQLSSGQLSSGQASSGQLASGQASSGQLSSGQASSGQLASRQLAFLGQASSGQHSSLSQFPASGNLPASGQYFSTGNIPTSGQYFSTGNIPTSGQYPASGNIPTSGQYPASGNIPTAGQYPASGNIPTAGQYPASGQHYSTENFPISGHVLNTGNFPVSSQFQDSSQLTNAQKPVAGTSGLGTQGLSELSSSQPKSVPESSSNFVAPRKRPATTAEPSLPSKVASTAFSPLKVNLVTNLQIPPHFDLNQFLYKKIPEFVNKEYKLERKKYTVEGKEFDGPGFTLHTTKDYTLTVNEKSLAIEIGILVRIPIDTCGVIYPYDVDDIKDGIFIRGQNIDHSAQYFSKISITAQNLEEHDVKIRKGRPIAQLILDVGSCPVIN